MDRLVTKLKDESEPSAAEKYEGQRNNRAQKQLSGNTKNKVVDTSQKSAIPNNGNSRAVKVAPAVALHNQKLVRRMEEEYRRMKL